MSFVHVYFAFHTFERNIAIHLLIQCGFSLLHFQEMKSVNGLNGVSNGHSTISGDDAALKEKSKTSGSGSHHHKSSSKDKHRDKDRDRHRDHKSSKSGHSHSTSDKYV